MSGGDTSMPSNGAGAPSLSNGAAAASRPAPAVAPNGTAKPGPAVNGSSNGESSNGDGSSGPVIRRGTTYFGHDREEVTRILLQALNDMGYQDAARSVSRDSGYELENPTVAAFRSAVISGSWAEAEDLLLYAAEPDTDAADRNGLVLAKGSDRNLMRFWLRQQKYLELLEQRDTSQALSVLREELTPLYNDTSKLHFLSSLLMSQSTEDLKARARWDGAAGRSRRALLSNLSRCISPSVMLPENRLAVLLQSVKQNQIDTCLYHTAASSPSLYSDHSCPPSRFPTEIAMELVDLEDEAWQIEFSPDGDMLAGCGPTRVVVWNSSFKVHLKLEAHLAGVGNISWSPDGSMLVTCSQDNTAKVWRIEDGECLKRTKRFSEPVSGCVWARDGQSFVIGTLDHKRSLCTYDIHTWEVTEWGRKHRVQDLCGSPDGRWLVAMDDQCTLHVYNAVTRELAYELDVSARPTSVCISEDSRHLLVNKRDGEAQLIDLETRISVQKFLGHTGGEFLIRSSFGGANESFVASGSEDGNILIWHKTIGAAVERLPGHKPRCNAVSWKPDDPSMLASCGDDGKVRLWTDKARARLIREGLRPPLEDHGL